MVEVENMRAARDQEPEVSHDFVSESRVTH